MGNVYTVTQVNTYIKRMFLSDYALGHIMIMGEVSNCKHHSSGHIYFTLKDQSAQISCVMFKSHAMYLNMPLADGQNVIITGNVSVYERDGKYQVYVEKVVLDGQGALQLQYEKLKKQLEQEGLFDFEHKKEIPKFPKKVGIVTAKTGAAIRDIMNIAQRRNPYVQLILYPAIVQGKEAAASIVKGIKALDGKVDTIIVGRGGGSIEDLWAFNEEVVARAIYEANTPIISGVGHEVDTTISDYVADLRAPTPSAACELAIYEVEQVIGQLNEYKSKMNQVMEHKLAYKKMCLLRQKEKLTYLSPMNQVKEKMQRLADLRELLERNIEQRITKEKHRLQLYLQKLHGLSPTSKLINGYGYITSEKEKPIRGIGDVKEKDMLYITLSDGKLKAQVIDVRKD